MTVTHSNLSTSVGADLEYDPADVAVGASFGNPAGFIRTTLAADLDHLWQAATGRWFFGSVQMDFIQCEKTLAPARCVFEPAAMRGVYQTAELVIDKRTFVPAGDQCAAYLWAQVRNTTTVACEVRVALRGQLHAAPSAMHRRQAAPADMQRVFTPVSAQALRMNWREYGLLRAASADGAMVQVTSSACAAPVWDGEGCWSLTQVITLQPHEVHSFWICLEALQGEPASLPPADAPTAWTQQNEAVQALARTVQMGTRWPLLNDGVFRSKVNTRRVMHGFAQGTGFNNDPPGTLVVTRDAAWFTMGANYFFPDFCRAMLDTLTRNAPYPNGKIAEYLDLNTDPVFVEDYGLNIADPTPLYILAIERYAAMSGDTDWLRVSFPTALAAARYILTQTHDGLVINDSTRFESSLGVCGWRNVMENTNISGAVTELHTECTAAVQACVRMANLLGEEQAAQDMCAALPAMTQALNDRLWDKERGRFRLSLDPAQPGRYDEADTVDQVFPVLLGLASDEQAQATVERLFTPPYRAAHGVRTAPKGHPDYHAENLWGLTGGVWPNASAWVAVAAAPYQPALAIKLMEDVARPLYEPRPALCGALTPGQFPEWLDGDVCVSKGMALSPWMPPTYTWMVLEGLFGLRPGLDGLSLEPHVPTQTALFVRGVRYRGESLSLLVTPECVYSTHPLVKCSRPVQIATDVTGQWSDSAEAIVMQPPGGLAACVHAAAACPVKLGGALGTLAPGQWLQVKGNHELL